VFMNRGALDPQVSNRRRWLQKTRVGLSRLNVSRALDDASLPTAWD
jgi:hypothetical protein